ncbi:hypothetical protein EVA_16877 [gut metagenome]|uniref:Uncharacterized protein n=1 Tax=gut metagenome TaxID=749906 RepID=J9FZN9_9ZZZZ
MLLRAPTISTRLTSLHAMFLLILLRASPLFVTLSPAVLSL